jgi:hypothetical protein
MTIETTAPVMPRGRPPPGLLNSTNTAPATTTSA